MEEQRGELKRVLKLKDLAIYGIAFYDADRAGVYLWKRVRGDRRHTGQCLRRGHDRNAVYSYQLREHGGSLSGSGFYIFLYTERD